MLRSAIHEKLCEMKKVFAFCWIFVDCALLIHVDELTLTNLFVQILIEFPYHALNLRFSHFDVHASKCLLQLFSSKELACVWRCKYLKDFKQILFFSGVYFKLFQFFFDGLLLLRLTLTQFLHVELEFTLGQTVLLFENYRIFILTL